MDAQFYAGLAAELNEKLRGLTIRGVEDPVVEGRNPEGMLLRFLGQSGGLMIALDRDCPGIFWTRSISGRRTVRGLHQRLLPRIQDAEVVAVRQPAPDRVLALDLQTPEGARTLWLEMTGRLGNLILTDENNIIVVIGRAVFEGMSRARQLEVGLPYVGPPLPKSWKQVREEAETPASYTAAAEEAWKTRERSLAMGRKRGELLSKIRGRIERRKRLLGHLEEEQSAAGKGEKHRLEADHLAAYLHLVKRGQTELVCERFDGEGELTITLDPTRSAAENLELLFKRARKAERAKDRLTQRGIEILGDLEQLEIWLKATEAARQWEDLIAVEAKLPEEAADDRDLETDRLPAGVQAFGTSNGLIVLVGKTAQGNHAVTFELAKPRDLWFHARDYPGSHVVLRGHGKRVSPPHAILEAAALAAYFSKAAGHAVVDVACCPRHRVRAQKDAGPGKVNYSGEKTISVRMEAEMLDPLLKRRRSTEAS